MALKAGRVGVNPNYVDKEGRPLYDNSYLKELLRKEGIITLFTKEGNPISIDNAVEGHLYSCIVTLSPKQAGTGDPSPTNIRAISGYDTLKITANSVDTDYSFDNTVYGGVLDVSTGVLTVTHKYLNLKNIVGTWSKSTTYSGGFYTPAGENDFKIFTAFKCTHAKYVTTISEYITGTCYCDGSINIRIMAAEDTVQDWLDYIDAQDSLGTPVVICGELSTPTTVQLTPAQITLVTGSNTVSSTTGTTMDLKYLGTLVPGGANGRSLNRSLNLNREVIDEEEKKEIQEEIKEVPVEEPVTVKKSTKKSTK